MDGLDLQILGVLGFEAFDRWPRSDGITAAAVARAVGKGPRLVADRMARLEQVGVIGGYRILPNPRHLGLDVTTVHVDAPNASPAGALEAFGDVEGFLNVVPYVGAGLCVTVLHGNAPSLERRLQVMGRLAGSARPPRVLYRHALPAVKRPLSRLDWRILAALLDDARRPAPAAAEEVGVTVKTLRTRLGRMRREGAFDHFVSVDFSRLEGLIPFEVAVWAESNENGLAARLTRRFRDRILTHFRPPANGYCDLVLRLAVPTPAHVQRAADEIAQEPGVVRAVPLVAAGFQFNAALVRELVNGKVGAGDGVP